MKNVILFLLTTIFLAGCKTINIKNGEVPDKYLSQAKKFEGIYHGTFEGQTGKMKIAFEGNRPYISATDSKGKDLLFPECNTDIKQLKWVEITKKKTVKSAGFYFNPGSCNIEGREIILSFSDQNKIYLQLLKRSVSEKECRWVINDPLRGPYWDCTFVKRGIYLNGKFTR